MTCHISSGVEFSTCVIVQIDSDVETFQIVLFLIDHSLPGYMPLQGEEGVHKGSWGFCKVINYMLKMVLTTVSQRMLLVIVLWIPSSRRVFAPHLVDNPLEGKDRLSYGLHAHKRHVVPHTQPQQFPICFMSDILRVSLCLFLWERNRKRLKKGRSASRLLGKKK